MALLAPSILAANWSNLEQELESCAEKGITHIHCDVMDGNFVPDISFGAKLVHDLKKKFPLLFFDIHLMVLNPIQYIDTFADAGADAITFHIEEEKFFYRMVEKIRKRNISVGVACNPKTPLICIQELISDIDIVLIMSVDPGFGGQTFITSSLQKIEKLQHIRITNNMNFKISVDGGVNNENTHALIEAGADILVMGSAFFSVNDKDKLSIIKSIQLPLSI